MSRPEDVEAAVEGRVVAALTDALLARYPRRFTSADADRLRRAVGQIVECAARLRTYPLANADEPDPVFHAVRRPE